MTKHGLHLQSEDRMALEEQQGQGGTLISHLFIPLMISFTSLIIAYSCLQIS